jgi:hypothetical protein
MGRTASLNEDIASRESKLCFVPPTPALPVAEYASPDHVARRLTLGDFVFYAATTFLFEALLATPALLIHPMKRVFEDFKLELPRPTEMVIHFYDLLGGTYVFYWGAALPFALPFLVGQMRRDVRGRLLLLVVLLAGLVVLLAVVAMILPLYALIDGITGSGGRK